MLWTDIDYGEDQSAILALRAGPSCPYYLRILRFVVLNSLFNSGLVRCSSLNVYVRPAIGWQGLVIWHAVVPLVCENFRGAQRLDAFSLCSGVQATTFPSHANFHSKHAIRHENDLRRDIEIPYAILGC
jgi:hypothetical protein